MTGQRIGYARTAAVSDEIDAQVAALEKAGCATVFQDSGKAPPDGAFPGMAEVLASLGPDDTLVLSSLDRLPRSGGFNIAAQLRERGVRIEALDAPDNRDMLDGVFGSPQPKH
jgi:DNA invertase Pin-like site-specific DNA recombinase